LIFAPTPSGGLAEHAFYQARALHKMGLSVTCLTSKSFLASRAAKFDIKRKLFDMPESKVATWIRRPWQVLSLVSHQWVLVYWILVLKPDLILLDSYAEYLSPFWVWPHWLLSRVFGVIYAANLHDPVRKNLIGPSLWHQLSVELAYKPLKVVLVHGPIQPEARVPSWVKTVEVPVGVYDIPRSNIPRGEVRRSWGARPDQHVFLSFGFVRDGKNLDLAIRALKDVPTAFLVIAGSVASKSDKPFAFYRDLARRLGVDGRCFLSEGFVADEQLGEMFEGADFVLLTYSASFRSQSGVLNLATRARKLVLASSAPGPLVDVVYRFNLGVVVEPDSATAVAQGFKELSTSQVQPRWGDYERYAGWDTNALKLVEAVLAFRRRSDASIATVQAENL
jgi:glycosyltransferase involved in cell wall biosynthesis